MSITKKNLGKVPALTNFLPYALGHVGQLLVAGSDERLLSGQLSQVGRDIRVDVHLHKCKY